MQSSYSFTASHRSEIKIVHGVSNQIGSTTLLSGYTFNLHKPPPPPPTPPNKSKGKCTTAMYTMLHNHTKYFQCGIRSCPPIQNADILLCFLSPYFFYVCFSPTISCRFYFYSSMVIGNCYQNIINSENP